MTKSFLRLCLLCAWLAVCLPAAAKEKIRVACIGNSITYGLTLADPPTESYPALLQQLLSDGYDVANFGHSGTTLLRHGHRPYVAQQAWRDAQAFRPDVAVIHLGVNDTDPRNWPDYGDEFVGDYLALIDTLRQQNPDCRVIIARLTPITFRHARFESGTRDWQREIQRCIETVAEVARAELIDFHRPLYALPQLQPDAVHPNAEGARLLAETVRGAITGQYGGLAMAPIYSDGMVLQRGRPLTIHGRADAGTQVTVSIGRQRVSAQTDNRGDWSATLQPMDAARGLTLTVATKRQTLTYRDVAVGEVWLCSGQSNMEFTLDGCATIQEDLSGADRPDIRLFDMKARWRTDAVAWPREVLDSINHLHYFRPTAWQRCSRETAARFSAVAYHFGRMLSDSLGVPVGLICNAVGGAPTEAWIDRATMEADFPALLRDWSANDFVQPWVRQRASLNTSLAAEGQPARHPYEPCYLFEAGIEPLDHFAVRGVTWYQGESNAHNKDAHERLFRMLVGSWREYFGDRQMPFYYVQLSSLNRPSWPAFRDSQRRLQDQIPHTGMAVSSDVGDSTDVHPRDKRPVGERLARLALHNDYGYTHVRSSGPLAERAWAVGDTVWVGFRHADALQTSDGHPLRTFELAEHEGLFYPAEAVIVDDRVRLHSTRVAHPRYVRYGWQPFTRANLTSAGLPASTFRLTVDGEE